VLNKVIQEHVPTDRATWEMCVRQAHVKNQLIQNYGYTPHQFVFGHNPMFPGDLLNEPMHLVPATAGPTNEAIKHAQSIRTSARKAVIETSLARPSARVGKICCRRTGCPLERTEVLSVPRNCDTRWPMAQNSNGHWESWS
jgi:hypothetical protein